MRIRIDLSYDGTDFQGWATQPGAAHRPGHPRGGARHRAAGARPSRVVCAGAPTPASTPAGRWSTCDLDGRRRARRTAAAPAQRHPAARRAGARGRGRRRGFRRPVLGALAALRLPGRRRPRARSTRSRRHHVLCVAAAAGRRRDGAASRRAARAAGLRGVLQAPRGGDHDPYAAGARRGPGTPTGSRWRRCGPTRSATTWSARWSAACWRSGEGRRPPEWAAEVLAARARDPAVAVVPAHGLTLEEVGYPDAARAGRAGRAGAREAGDDVSDEDHYFTADPSVPFAREDVHVRGVGPRARR